MYAVRAILCTAKPSARAPRRNRLEKTRPAPARYETLGAPNLLDALLLQPPKHPYAHTQIPAMPSFKDTLDLFKESFKEWSDDGAMRLGAALAYYTLFSLAPLLMIITRILGSIWGGQGGDVQAEVMMQAEALVGRQGADGIRMMLENAGQSGDAGTVATVVSAVALVFGATGLFAALQGALNVVWDVRTKPGRALSSFVKTRLLSFGMIVALGFLLLMSLIATAAVAVLNDWLFERIPGGSAFAWIADLVVSFGVIMLLFALIYRILPDVEIAWRDVLVGASVTAALFLVGKYLIGFYLGQSTMASSYGAAGSIVVLLVWIYYSSQLVFFGAEFTQVWARRYGERLVPAPYAERILNLTNDEIAQIKAQRAANDHANDDGRQSGGHLASSENAENAEDTRELIPPNKPTSGYLGHLDAPLSKERGDA